MTDLPRILADIWMIVAMAVVVWFLWREFDSRQTGDWIGMAACVPVIMWGGCLAINDLAGLGWLWAWVDGFSAVGWGV